MKYIFFVLFFLTAPLAKAHHTSGSAGTSSLKSTRQLILNQNAAKPTKQAYTLFETRQLDESVGQVHELVMGFEWGLNQKFSFGFGLPIDWIRHNARSNATGLADVFGQLKFLMVSKDKWTSLLSTSLTFPTGQDQKGLGAGSVTQDLTWLNLFRQGKWNIFLSATPYFRYSSKTEPQLTNAAGVISPRLIHNHVNLVLQASHTTYLDSQVFSSGSGKLFAEPQINLFLDKDSSWVLSLGFRVSLWDHLSRKSGVTITNTNNVLLGDVLFSGSLGLTKQFN